MKPRMMSSNLATLDTGIKGHFVEVTVEVKSQAELESRALSVESKRAEACSISSVYQGIPILQLGAAGTERGVMIFVVGVRRQASDRVVQESVYCRTKLFNILPKLVLRGSCSCVVGGGGGGLAMAGL
jgi:hypothetical protein